MNWRTLKEKLKQLDSDKIQVYFVALCWIAFFVTLMFYSARNPIQPEREIPKTSHREWSGKFY